MAFLEKSQSINDTGGSWRGWTAKQNAVGITVCTKMEIKEGSNCSIVKGRFENDIEENGHKLDHFALFHRINVERIDNGFGRNQ
jgi:hypothetical protein